MISVNGQSIIKGNRDNGSLDINVQDQTTAPLVSDFFHFVSNFTLAVDTVASTLEVLNYTFTATTGHGIVIGSQIYLIDIVGDRTLFCEVVNVATDTITVDRPIDNAFPAGTSLGRIITSDMAVVGSLVTPVIFSMRAGAVEVDVVNVILSIADDVIMDDGKFGGIPALTNGLVLRMSNGYQQTVVNIKSNADIQKYGAALSYSDKAPAGIYGLTGLFPARERLGVTFRVSDTSVLQWVVQDDLTALSAISAAAIGHLTD